MKDAACFVDTPRHNMTSSEVVMELSELFTIRYPLIQYAMPKKLKNTLKHKRNQKHEYVRSFANHKWS